MIVNIHTQTKRLNINIVYDMLHQYCENYVLDDELDPACIVGYMLLYPDYAINRKIIASQT